MPRAGNSPVVSAGFSAGRSVAEAEGEVTATVPSTPVSTPPRRSPAARDRRGLRWRPVVRIDDMAASRIKNR
ncbi:hypothetical protein GCM10027160_41940 [Streptomyces calidiresistens]